MLALFFLPTVYADSLLTSLEKINEEELYNNKTWHSLLHLKSNKPQINDTKFLLSYPKFSAKAEMLKTVKYFFNMPDKAMCRFPARMLFLNQHLSLNLDDINIESSCAEQKKYRDLVPFDDVNLIFASEVLSSASSMMGHTFLNVEGVNVNKNKVSHSLSFFTEFDTFNPFKLIYDGLISGMEGFFMVRPFDIDFNRYSKVEGRNVWSYKLTIDEFNKLLIKMHIWELKELEIEYLFQSYNCATLTLYVLSIAKPDLLNEEKLYVSPVDVVKAIKKHDLVENTTVKLTDDWAVNMLNQELDNDVLEKVNLMIFDSKPFSLDELPLDAQLLVRDYILIMLNKFGDTELINDLDKQKLQKLIQSLAGIELNIDLTAYKDPAKTKQDSIITASISRQLNKTYFDMTFLPASHNLYGDNSQYFSESELKIAELELRSDLNKGSLKLQSFTLYSVKSYVPSESRLSQLSGDFYLGYRHMYNDELKNKSALLLSGAVGKTYKLHDDVSFYVLFGAGVGSNIKKTFGFIEPYVGVIFNLIADSKAILEHRMSIGHFGEGSLKQSTSLRYAWNGLDEKTISLSVKSTQVSGLHETEWSLGFNYYF